MIKFIVLIIFLVRGEDMKIDEEYNLNMDVFLEKGIIIPRYNDIQVVETTKVKPQWVHFGGGNLYRCLHAKVAQDLLNQNLTKTGIIVIERANGHKNESIYKKNKNKSLTVSMSSDGTNTKELIASTAGAFFLDKDDSNTIKNISSLFKNCSLQLVTMTITEKGYRVKDSNDTILSNVQSEIDSGPIISRLETTISQLAFFLLERYESGKYPIAVLSTDNFSHNGDILKNSLSIIVDGWTKKGYVSEEFSDYLFKSKKVSFPYTMVDRITPNPSESISEMLKNQGIEGMELEKDNRGNTVASFVNTEDVYYFVMEDDFPNGRPEFEKVENVYVSDRETVNRVDLMKVTVCLNPLHTSLAIAGCLFGYKTIYQAVQDDDLLKLIKFIGYKEGLPVVQDTKIINPKSFLNEVIYKRFMNPNIPDTPQRIVTDTSQKLAVRFGETIKAYIKSPTLKTSQLIFIPFIIALWCRYLMGVDDDGNVFHPSPDPLYDTLYSYVKPLKLGKKNNIHNALLPILSDAEIFGLDLYTTELGIKIERFMEKILRCPHAVRETLKILILEEEENKQDGNGI